MNPKKLDHALDHFLYESCRKRTKVEIFLLSGRRVFGRIVEYDEYSILLDAQGTQLLLYKKGIVRISRFKVSPLQKSPHVKLGKRSTVNGSGTYQLPLLEGRTVPNEHLGYEVQIEEPTTEVSDETKD